MRLKKFLALLAVLCVMFAPVVSNAAFSMDIPVAYTQEHKADCHTQAASDGHATHDGAHHSDAKISHGCCFSFVGMLPDTKQPQSTQDPNGLIPFNPTLSLTARTEGLYRPPRQFS